MKTLIGLLLIMFCTNCLGQNFETGFLAKTGMSRFTGVTNKYTASKESSSFQPSGSFGIFCNWNLGLNFWLSSGIGLDKIVGKIIMESKSNSPVIIRSGNNPSVVVGHGRLTLGSEELYYLHYISFPLAMEYKLKRITLRAGGNFMFHYYSYQKNRSYSIRNLNLDPGVILSGLSRTTNSPIDIQDQTDLSKVAFLFDAGVFYNIKGRLELGGLLSHSAFGIFNSQRDINYGLFSASFGIKYFMTKTNQSN